MSKMKLSFSLIIALLLVGIMSTAVFARGAYWASLSPDGVGGWNFKFVNTNGTDQTQFSVKVYSNTDKYAQKLYETSAVTGIATNAEPTGVASDYTTISIAKSVDTVDFQVGTIYKFVLSDGSKDLAVQFGALTNHDNLNMASIATSPTGVTLDVNGSKLYNANHTGTSGAARKGGNTHGFYQNNTNSCASCHQTHTAANGEYLLFKDGIYSTCSACHDGTTGAYNSFAPANSETPNETAGTFNVITDGTAGTHNGSLHQADGSIQISAAPGGNGKYDSSDKASNSIWGGEFDCASCHAAHGAGSAAENNLNLDPLGWGQLAYNANGTADQKNGKLFKDVTPLDLDSYTTQTEKDAALATFTKPFILVKKAAVDTDFPKKNGADDKTKAGYLWTRAGVQVGDKVIQTYRWNGQKYVADYSLWLRDTGHVGAPFENANTFFTGVDGDVTNTLNVVWKDGFAFGSAAVVDAVTKAQFSIGIDVETTNDMATLFNSANANYIVDSGTEMSKYCASCHVDYLSSTRTNDTGVYTTAHRHQTASDTLTCVRCHFAHGSDAQIMKDANDETYWTLGANADALNYLVDKNYSSALKRYTGMSVCYACHGQGEQFKANPNNKHDQSSDPAVKAIFGSHAVGGTSAGAGGAELKSGQPGTR